MSGRPINRTLWARARRLGSGHAWRGRGAPHARGVSHRPVRILPVGLVRASHDSCNTAVQRRGRLGGLLSFYYREAT